MTDIYENYLVEVVTPACFACGESSTVKVDMNAYRYWRNGDLLIQDAFPAMSPADREVLKTGTHPSCWDSMFGDEEDLED